MRKSSSFFVICVAIAAIGAAAWFGGGILWTKLLEMHGIHRTAHVTPGAPAASWPETHAGTIAKGWVGAFSSGEEAMRDFRRQNTAAEVLPEHTDAERDAAFRGLKERFGTLKLVSIVSSEPSELEVVLSAADGSEQNFIFEVEKESPFKLLAIKMREKHHLL